MSALTCSQTFQLTGHKEFVEAKLHMGSIILLYGPGGTGKSFAYQSLQGHLHQMDWKMPIFVLSASSMEDKYIGESQKRVAAWFSMCKKQAPCIMVMEEIDSVMKSRDLSPNGTDHHLKLQTELLHQMQREKLPPGVILICTTNRAWVLDPAFNRRMTQVYMRLPNANERYGYLCTHLDQVRKKFFFDLGHGERATMDEFKVLKMIRKFSDTLVK